MAVVNQAYRDKIQLYSEKIVEVQKPIRVLDSIKWDPSVESDFFANGGKALPKVDRESYHRTPLGFDIHKKDQELADLGRCIRSDIGADDELGRLMVSMVDQYRELIVMLEARGTPKFYDCSKKLYGSPRDVFFGDKVTVLDQGRQLQTILASLEKKFLGHEYPKNIPATEVVRRLRERFANSFLKDHIEVRLSDGIVADAAAGSDVIKIKESAMFSEKDIAIFEVHEGWVHVATTLNGKNQKIAKFLSKGPPRCACTQEGLAIMMEIFTFSTYPVRARSINDRVLGIAMAEDGANFLEVYEFYLSQGYSNQEGFRNSMRVFRGGMVEGGVPFTKDISYCRGFIENYNFIRTAIRKGHPEIVPFLFVGKLHVDDVPLLYQKHLEGIIDAPTYLPTHFEDLNPLAVWMSFSNFLNVVDMKTVSEYFDGLFRKYL